MIWFNMKYFQDKINYKRLLAVAKNKRGKEKSFQWRNYITDIYILGKPWKNIHKFWSIWNKILKNLEMYKSPL